MSARRTATQDEINAILWRACDTFRGAIDPAQYKDYILTMLFVKYLSDLTQDLREGYEARYNGDAQRVERAMSRERFIVPAQATFGYLYQHRDDDNIGELVNIALDAIEDSNRAKLEGVFRGIDFNSEANLGQTADRNRRLRNLIEDFAKLDLRPSHLQHRDVIGDAYEYLIGQFAAGGGKKAGEFYTPPEVSQLLARLVAPQSGDRICDPSCGSGSLLIRVAREVPDGNFFLAGQESNGSTWSLCRMNMYLHGCDAARIEWCDTLNSPRLIEGDRLMRFEVVVANPPFSLDKWGAEGAANDQYRRFWRGVPPKSKGDYAFISHMVEIATEGRGRVGVIAPHGVLFRGGSEGAIRRKLIEENLLDAVIGLPSNLFFGTGIPACILLFDKGRARREVLFIDASREYDAGRNQNRLRPEDINRIVQTHRAYETVQRYTYAATPAEIAENDFNLNIPRYVDTYEPEAEVDIAAVQADIDRIEAELAETRQQMRRYLRELGFAEGGDK
ncbi:MAG: type I restriction-modification system subunit M [Armatimonadetes bacterium]|nr:type I restriction-modification system subunit M [Armatimonadota bacterium]